ncbi:ester cyclase [Rhodanobacter sp. BL-MT-08]
MTLRIGTSVFTAGFLIIGLTLTPMSRADAARSGVSRQHLVQLMHRFDQLDFDAFSKQNWTLFDEIHCPDVTVTYPDGHVTHGIKQHQKDIAAMFSATPDMRVSAHPVSFASDEWASLTPQKRTSEQTLVAGDWTATVGVLQATFTRPMDMGGHTIQPTGRKLNLSMATIAHWKNGCIAEEHLFWDNAAYMRQLGISP